MRKKAVQNLDSRQLTLIENAFFYCNPPERQKVILIKKLSSSHLSASYERSLIFAYFKAGLQHVIYIF